MQAATSVVSDREVRHLVRRMSSKSIKSPPASVSKEVDSGSDRFSDRLSDARPSEGRRDLLSSAASHASDDLHPFETARSVSAPAKKKRECKR